MTKYEFEDYKKKCPWFFRTKSEPKCMAQNSKHCCKKNCAIAYWKGVLNEPYRN